MKPIETSPSRQMRASGTSPASTSAMPMDVANGSADGEGRWKSPPVWSGSAIAHQDSDEQGGGEEQRREDPQLEGQDEVSLCGGLVEHPAFSLLWRRPWPPPGADR